MYHKWDINQYFLFTLKVTSTEKVWQDRHILFFCQFSEIRCQFFGAGCRPFSFLLFLYRNTWNQLFMFDQKDDSGKAMRIFREKITLFFSRWKTINKIMKKTGEWKKECNLHQDNNSVLRKTRTKGLCAMITNLQIGNSTSYQFSTISLLSILNFGNLSILNFGNLST